MREECPDGLELPDTLLRMSICVIEICWRPNKKKSVEQMGIRGRGGGGGGGGSRSALKLSLLNKEILLAFPFFALFFCAIIGAK
jgi:hypothetical protein